MVIGTKDVTTGVSRPPNRVIDGAFGEAAEKALMADLASQPLAGLFGHAQMYLVTEVGAPKTRGG